jgi:uncharacterized membrane protein
VNSTVFSTWQLKPTLLDWLGVALIALGAVLVAL